MVTVLGISALYHDAAAAIVVDGEIIAAAEEERFSRVKHDARMPVEAVRYCLSAADITANDIDHVVFYEKPLTKFERLLETYLATAPRSLPTFLRGFPLWVREKLFPRQILRETFPDLPRKRPLFVEHHESHAASAFYPSPFKDAAILTVDGVGEWTTTAFGVGDGTDLRLLAELEFPHSLGMLYSAFTQHCGFRVNSGEYKLMGLAPYGEPVYRDRILRHLIDIKPDGSFRLDLSYFRFHRGLTMTSRRFEKLFRQRSRTPREPLSDHHRNMAASIQAVTEEILLRMATHVRQATERNRLCLAGGVAMNSVANGRLARAGIFEEIWVQPAAGDSGGALGAALFVSHQLLGQKRDPVRERGGSQRGSRLGPMLDERETERRLRERGVRFESVPDREQRAERVARRLADGAVVGWVQGRMEFGPRALGSRSLLADPRSPMMRDRLNRLVKHRESFRPFAPVVLRERAAEFFDLAGIGESPQMQFVVPVRQGPFPLPAVTHVDGSARVQTVAEHDDADLHALLNAFDRLTGCPVLVNTSFNVRGEPIVCTTDDALNCFQQTDIDLLVLGSHLIEKAAS